MEILRCEGVRKVYGSGESRVAALDGVNLSLGKGEFAAVVGTSGSGKSTLLHILGSVEQPTEGHVFIEGKDITSLNRTQSALLRRRKVGIVYQFYNLIPTLTVRKNIMFPLENLKGKDRLSKEEMEKRVLDAAKMVSLEELLDQEEVFSLEHLMTLCSI